MDSHLLKVFVSVAKNESISQAAIELQCAQSNVTSRIKQLEKNIGYKLFHRVSKGVKLTRTGDKLYPNALEIVHKIEQTELLMKNIDTQNSLKIATTQANAPIRLIPFISKLKKDYSNINIELYTNTSLNIIDSIINYDIDIGFICGKIEHKDIKILREFEEEIFIVRGKNNSKNCVFTYIDSCIYYKYYNTYLKANNNYDFETVIIQNYEIILASIELGMGSAALPLNIIKKYGYENKLELEKIINTNSNTNFSTCLICRNDYEPSISEYLKQMKI